jgi:hypothetical protein
MQNICKKCELVGHQSYVSGHSDAIMRMQDEIRVLQEKLKKDNTFGIDAIRIIEIINKRLIDIYNMESY